MHPVHNAVDHGIEAPAERRAAGKPQAGRIDLRGRREAGSVVIEIEDDGRGIQWQEIQRRVDGPAAVPSTRGRLIEALVGQGVSTAREITELSGRGLGMGALHAAVRALGRRSGNRQRARPGHAAPQAFSRILRAPGHVGCARKQRSDDAPVRRADWTVRARSG